MSDLIVYGFPYSTFVHIVRLILKDPGLSSKILRVVNSAYYRQQSDSISTVTKAVIILGFETMSGATSDGRQVTVMVNLDPGETDAQNTDLQRAVTTALCAGQSPSN